MMGTRGWRPASGGQCQRARQVPSKRRLPRPRGSQQPSLFLGRVGRAGARDTGSVGVASVCFIRLGREETTRVTSGDSGGHEAGFYPSEFRPLPYELVTHGHNRAPLVAQRVRSPGSSESTCKAGDPGSIPGSGRSPGEGNGNPVQYSYLENPICMKNVTCHISKQKMLQPLS